MTEKIINTIPKEIKQRATGTASYYDDRDDILREEIERQRAEIRRKQANRLWKASNVGKRFEEVSFDSYRGDLQARSVCENWVDFYAEGAGLLLCGGYGVGKTHLAISTARATLERYKTTVWIDTFAGMLQELKSAYSQPAEFSKALAKYKDVDLLVIDDLGKENLTSWANETLFTVIDSRYRDMKSLIITTNLMPNELSKHIDEAVMSRLAEMCRFVKVEGTDYRLKKRGEQK